MPRDTLGDYVPDYELSDEGKDCRASELRAAARKALTKGKPYYARYFNARARNFPRRVSHRAEHPSMKAWISQYRKLLVAESSLKGILEALSLVQSILGGTINAHGTELSVSLKGKRSAASLKGLLTEVAQTLDLTVLTTKRRRATYGNLKEQEITLSTALLLSLAPTVATSMKPPLPEARFSLLLDACLVLFYQAYFGFLPRIFDGWDVERKTLLTSFQLLAEKLPRAADRFHVLALTYDALGDALRADEYFREVVAATPSDAHDFMTCLQSAWSYLMELERFNEAFEFLVETMPRVTLADQDEFRELLRQTFSLAHAHSES